MALRHPIFLQHFILCMQILVPRDDEFRKQKYFRICIHTKDLLRCLKMVICILHGVSVLNSAVSITIMHNLVMLREEKKHIRKRKKTQNNVRREKNEIRGHSMLCLTGGLYFINILWCFYVNRAFGIKIATWSVINCFHIQRSDRGKFSDVKRTKWPNVRISKLCSLNFLFASFSAIQIYFLGLNLRILDKLLLVQFAIHWNQIHFGVIVFHHIKTLGAPLFLC